MTCWQGCSYTGVNGVSHPQSWIRSRKNFELVGKMAAEPTADWLEKQRCTDKALAFSA